MTNSFVQGQLHETLMIKSSICSDFPDACFCLPGVLTLVVSPPITHSLCPLASACGQGGVLEDGAGTTQEKISMTPGRIRSTTMTWNAGIWLKAQKSVLFE